MTKVLIVDDHESMRETLEKTLGGIEGFNVVASIASAAYALAYCQRLHPQLVLMDVCTEGGASGLTATRQIHEAMPDVHVIVMTAFDEVSYLPRAKAAGADGFIYKSRSLAYFAETARDVMQGQKVFPQEKSIPVPQGEAPLTQREMEILRLLCRHMTNKQIGDELFISENTVKYHKANMLAKTGFATSVDLAFYMISNGWINPLY